MSLGDRVLAEKGRGTALETTSMALPTETSEDLAPLRQKFQAMAAALRTSNRRMAELQALLSQALDRYEACKAEETEARKAKDHHHHRWCILDQEREGLQRVAQQAQAAELRARSSERGAIEEAASLRRWLASFLEVLLKRSLSAVEEKSPQASEPSLAMLLAEVSAATERLEHQPELLARLPNLYDTVTKLISTGRLAVKWEGGHGAEVPAKSVADDNERFLQLERKLAQKEIAFVALEHEKRAMRAELRTLQNLVQELRGSIRVFCRVRPGKQPSADVAAGGLGSQAESSQRIVLRKPPGDRRHDFCFDRVFASDSSQRDLYEEIEPLLPSILEGSHVCIFAYGQTGAGKTYTLAGNSAKGQQGIQDFAIADLLRLANTRNQSGTSRYEIRLSALEIYNETIQDLLLDSNSIDRPWSSVSRAGAEPTTRLEVRQSREGAEPTALEGSFTSGGQTGSTTLPSPFGSMRVPGLKSWIVQGQEDIDRALRLMKENRHVAATCLNERSSRSHCVLSLSLVQLSEEQEELSVGVLHIIDLAGSERTKLSQAEGLQMKEANAINRSLSALADVLYALGDTGGNAHVPYRNSKLTYLLQDALGGPCCKTFLFAQISPDATDSNESYSTLTFASRVATSVQKARLRPPQPKGPRGDQGPRGSPPRATQAPRKDNLSASPRSQASDGADLLQSPAAARSRGPSSSQPRKAQSASFVTPDAKGRG